MEVYRKPGKYVHKLQRSRPRQRLENLPESDLEEAMKRESFSNEDPGKTGCKILVSLIKLINLE